MTSHLMSAKHKVYKFRFAHFGLGWVRFSEVGNIFCQPRVDYMCAMSKAGSDQVVYGMCQFRSVGMPSVRS